MDMITSCDGLAIHTKFKRLALSFPEIGGVSILKKWVSWHWPLSFICCNATTLLQTKLEVSIFIRSIHMRWSKFKQ